MRIRNFSGIAIPEELWYSFAECFGIGSLLPAVLLEPDMYGRCKTLSVTIRRVRKRASKKQITTGDHTYGRITLYPCPHCSAASLTQVYLHELVHAWLFQYHQKLYQSWDSCGLAETFADIGFRVLGGTVRPRALCGSYGLSVRVAKGRLPRFRQLVNSLTTDKDVKTWKPKRPN